MMKKIKIAGYQGKESVHTKAINEFISLINQKFSVSFMEDITSHNKKASELINQTQNGEIDVTYLFSSYFTDLIPELMYLDLPFYFNDKNEAFKQLDMRLKRFIYNELKNIHNLILLGFWDNGTRHISSSKNFINRPEDCKGQIIRTTPNKLHIDTFRTFGFIPKPLDVLDFKKALLNGDLDAQENPITNFYQFKVYETQKFFTKTSHVFGFCLFIINKKYFDGLSHDEKEIITNSSKIINLFQRNLAIEEENYLFNQIIKKNVQVADISVENKENFKRKSKKFHDIFFSTYKKFKN